MNRSGYITPSSFKKVMTVANGFKTREELEIELRDLALEQAKRESKGSTSTAIYASSQVRLTEIPNLIANWTPALRFGDTARDYAIEVALGRFGIMKPEIHAKSLEHGKRYEPDARALYTAMTGNDFPAENLRSVMPDYPFIAGECDGQIYRTDGRKWGGEIKCPSNPVNHWKNINGMEQFEDDYEYQTAAYCAMYDWEGFTAISYSPYFPGKGLISFKDYERNDELIKGLFETIELFEMSVVRPLVAEMEEVFEVKSDWGVQL